MLKLFCVVQTQDTRTEEGHIRQILRGSACAGQIRQILRGSARAGQIRQILRGSARAGLIRQILRGSACAGQIRQILRGSARAGQIRQILRGSAQGAPVPDRSARSSEGAPVPERSARSSEGAPVPDTSARSSEGAPVPDRSARSSEGAPVPDRSARSSEGAPVPDRSARSSEGAPVPDTSARSSEGAPVPDRSARSSEGAPVPDRSARSSEGAPVPDRSARSSEGAPVPAWFPKEAPVPRGSQQRGKLRIPLHLTKHLIQASLETPMPIQSPQREPVSASKVFTHSSHGASMQDKIGARPKVKIPEPEIAPLSCSQADLVVKKISERRDAEIPELRRQNTHNAPEPDSSAKLRIPKQREKLRDWWEHQQRQKNIQKGVSDSAGVDRSASQNKQRMAIQVNDRQSDPGGADQMDYLCCLFAKCFVI
ncbi:flocculation protein FLO11-like [Pimephales promelas]|uniref:flocculation protein FLO11-like n=1 Tax=Pimephales promelas TaxID=90988 RepID=UPI001955E23A|nr:flocculation protein FLO11-like [Pimephales promelas]